MRLPVPMALRALAVVAAVLLLAPPGLDAQLLHVGPRVGIGGARHVDSGEGWRVTSDRRLGPIVGVDAGIRLSPGFELRVEALYTEKGGERADGSWTRLAYLEMPVLLRYAADVELDDVRPFVVAGGALAREVACSGEGRAVDGSGAAVPIECDRERTFRGDRSVILGVGATRPVGGWRATAELRYARGVRNLVSGYEGRSRTNRVVALVLGVSTAIELP